MAAVSYSQVLSQVEQLTTDEQLRLLEEVAAIVRRRIETEPKQHSILELRGLGKEIWEGIDAQEYVNQERDSWDPPV